MRARLGRELTGPLSRFFALHGEDEKACEVMAVVEKEEVECIGRQEDLRRRKLAKLTTEVRFLLLTARTIPIRCEDDLEKYTAQ